MGIPVDAGRYALALAIERRSRGLDLATFKFDPNLHPRGLHGRFVDALNGLGDNEELKLPDGTKVQALPASGPSQAREFKVTGKDGTAASSINADEAATQALDASARHTDPKSVGGAKSYKSLRTAEQGATRKGLSDEGSKADLDAISNAILDRRAGRYTGHDEKQLNALHQRAVQGELTPDDKTVIKILRQRDKEFGRQGDEYLQGKPLGGGGKGGGAEPPSKGGGDSGGGGGGGDDPGSLIQAPPGWEASDKTGVFLVASDPENLDPQDPDGEWESMHIEVTEGAQPGTWWVQDFTVPVDGPDSRFDSLDQPEPGDYVVENVPGDKLNDVVQAITKGEPVENNLFDQPAQAASESAVPGGGATPEGAAHTIQKSLDQSATEAADAGQVEIDDVAFDAIYAWSDELEAAGWSFDEDQLRATKPDGDGVFLTTEDGLWWQAIPFKKGQSDADARTAWEKKNGGG